MVPSFRVRSFYLLDNAEAVSPGIRHLRPNGGEVGAAGKIQVLQAGV